MSNLKLGSNQYQKKYKNNMYSWLGFLLITIIVSYGFNYVATHQDEIASLIPAPKAKAKFISPLPDKTATAVNTIQATGIPEVKNGGPALAVPLTPTPTINIKDYIKTIFGKDWKIAYAVAKAESGLRPTAKLVWEREHSVGIFQINIQNKFSKVHYDRIPGKNLTEKQAWLSVPENNVLMAYWIYTKSGWNPWTAYTAKTYLAFME